MAGKKGTKRRRRVAPDLREPGGGPKKATANSQRVEEKRARRQDAQRLHEAERRKDGTAVRRTLEQIDAIQRMDAAIGFCQPACGDQRGI